MITENTAIQEILARIDTLAAELAALRDRVAALQVPNDPKDIKDFKAPKGLNTPKQWAFTLNDRYRFRRELFGNSDAEMVDTLELLAAMNSPEEVEEYLFVDLGWDSSNPDVAEFLAIVRRRFLDRPSNLL